MKDERAKYLIVDAHEIKKQLYKHERIAEFNDWFNIYTPDKLIKIKKYFDKNNIPEEFQKVIVKINGPSLINNSAEEYTLGFPFDLSNRIIKKDGKDKLIMVRNCPIFYDNQLFVDKVKFTTKLEYHKFEDIMLFLKDINKSGYLKLYLESIKEFFDKTINLDYLLENWGQDENSKKTLTLYKKTNNGYQF